jgi:glycosyltransferase involved in cell wall biosynthesis
MTDNHQTEAKTIRVGLISSEFPPDLGGVETYAWQLAKELGQRPGLVVSAYVPEKSASIPPPPGVTIKPILTSCIGLDWAHLKDEPIDVWHALSACHSWLALKGRPTIVSVHGNDFLTPYPSTARPALNMLGLWRLRNRIWRKYIGIWRRNTRRMLSLALPRATGLLSNSRYTSEVLFRNHPGCKGKTVTAWVGVEPSFFTVQHQGHDGRPTLLTVSRLSEPRKNVDKVLHALAALKDRFDFRYHVAGDGTQRAALEKLATQLGLDERVHFLGRVDDHELKNLYASADLFVLTASINPTSHEGFGIVYLEAAACGVPSLAARLAGAAEAVSEGQSGFFVDTPEIPEIEQALAAFLSGEMHFDPEACRNFARQFTWSRVADSAVALYSNALSAHHNTS